MRQMWKPTLQLQGWESANPFTPGKQTKKGSGRMWFEATGQPGSQFQNQSSNHSSSMWCSSRDNNHSGSLEEPGIPPVCQGPTGRVCRSKPDHDYLQTVRASGQPHWGRADGQCRSLWSARHRVFFPFSQVHILVCNYIHYKSWVMKRKYPVVKMSIHGKKDKHKNMHDWG